MPKLVIVESPAKAKTISRFLGNDYVVEASYGHVRDLPGNAAEIPEKVRKERWARLGVNTDADFEPIYVVPGDKKKHVARLKDALAGCSELLLATDEDREGESIVWHLLQLLKPGPKVKVRRIVFHEITPEAIRHAVAHPRDLDENLVRAQESRRIIDRLYGYTLSPLLWKKVQSGLSAGRVQSVAVRICVERERERAAFVSASYWDLAAELAAEGAGARPFATTLVRVGGRRVATGRDFEPTTGRVKKEVEASGEVAHLDEAAARALAARLAPPAGRDAWRVSLLETTPARQYPAPPFVTSTLQQEANRKLGFGAQRTMRAAQDLYEGVDLGGERVGLITYMRTDSVTLAERALEDAGRVVRTLYGPEFHPGKPVRYQTKSRNAQEAHEAIRPTELGRLPRDVEGALSPDQARLYELIWKRTIASQMKPAELLRTRVEVTAGAGDAAAVFATSGKAITFPGFLRAYVEGSDDPEAELADKETLLPELREGQRLDARSVAPQGHETQPPARYTEASLIRRLEEEGIGRPSTYASIIGTIEDRGYVFRDGKALVPTFTAYAVTQLLEGHFGDLVDLQFTSRMEEELDRVAEGSLDHLSLVRGFYRGTEAAPGLEQLVADKERSVDFPHIPLRRGAPAGGPPIVVRVGRYGPYLQRGAGGAGHTASIPGDLAPADLTYAKAEELIAAKSEGPRVLGTDPSTGWPVTIHAGRFGPYVQCGPPMEEKADKALLRRASLLPDQSEATLTFEEAMTLLAFPRELGPHPADAGPVSVNLGRFGPFIKHGTTYRSLAPDDDPKTIDLERALALLAAPPIRRAGGRGGAARAGGGSAAAAVPGRELGTHPDGGAKVVVKAGRYGPYVTDGTTNATLPKGDAPDTITLERAVELLRERAAAGGGAKKGRGGARGRVTARVAAAAKSASAPSSGARSAPKKRATTGAARSATKKSPATRKAAGTPRRPTPRPKAGT